MLAALLGSVLFSTKAILVKLSFTTIALDVSTLLALRMLFSLPFYGAMAVWARQKEKGEPLSRRRWLQIAGLGLGGYYLSSFFDFAGLQYISAGLERLILFLYPTFVLLLNSWVFKIPVSRRQWLAVLLTYAGIAFVFWGELNLLGYTPALLKGSLLILACAVTYAIYIAGSGRVIPKVGVTRFTAYAMLSATAGVLLHFLISHAGRVSDLFGEGHWQFGLLVAIVATVLPTFLTAKAMQLIGSNNVAIISSIGPVSTIIQAHFFLREPIFAEQLAGTALVIAGVVLIGWKKKENPAKIPV